MTDRKQWKEKDITEITATVNALFPETEEGACPVDVLTKALKASVVESCGECLICREGLYQLYAQAHSATQGNASEDDYNIMIEIADTMALTSRCDFGKLAGAKISAQLKANDEVFLKHIKRKRCDARVCEKLSDFPDPVERSEGGLMGGRRRRRSSG